MTSKINIDGHDYDLKQIVDRSMLLQRLKTKKSKTINIDGVEFDYSNREVREQIFHILEERTKGCNNDYFMATGDFILVEGEI